MVSTPERPLQSVSIADLEILPPGLYLLKARTPERSVEAFDCIHGTVVQVPLTGRVFARIRNGSELPSGVLKAWNRNDGNVVVLHEEPGTADPRAFAMSTHDLDLARTFLKLEPIC